jgi:glycosyltransferase involved in cell wall biosynthesis
MSDKTSVIICAYNYARFLPQCLESVVAQSQPADEIIVVDDGSTDDTPDVLKRFPQVRYLRQGNAGKAVAFNRGFCESQGDIICHLDADDYWLPEKLARVSGAFARADVGGVLHEAFYVDAGGKYLYRGEKSPGENAAERLLSFQAVLLMCFIYRPPHAIAGSLGVANTVCVRRGAVADCVPLPADLGLAVDGALLLSAARHGLIHLPEKLSAYRHHGGNHFVADPSSNRFQTRLFSWAATIPGVTSPKDRKLLDALMLEAKAYLAAYVGSQSLEGYSSSALLVARLLSLGIMPHWKHLGLPLASIMGQLRMRQALSRS